MSTVTATPSGPPRGAGEGAARGDGGRLRSGLVYLIPALLGTALCVISLTGRSLGFDEGATVAITSQHGHALWRGIAHDGGNMSGYYLLIHVLITAFGDGPWVLRLPSAVFAGITPGVVAAIALALWDDRRTAWIAGVLSAFSVPLVYWGQTTRGYAGMLCFACLGMLCFVRFVRAGERGAPGWGCLVGYVVAMGLAAYCGFIVALIVVPQLLALALMPRGRALLVRFAVALVALVVVCVPILVLAHDRGSGQLFWVTRPNGQTDAYVMQELTGSGFQSTFHRVATTTPGWIALSLVLIGLVVVAVRSRLGGWGLRLALLWAIVPGLLEFVGSYVAQPVFLPRNVLLSVPAVALGFAVVLADRRLPRWVAVAGVGIVLAVRAVPVAASYGAAPEPWSEVAASVIARTQAGDCITFYPEDARNAFRYYVSRMGAVGRAPRSVLPDVGWSVTRPYVELYPTLKLRRIPALRASCRRMWLVSSHEGQPSGPHQSRVHLHRWLVLRGRLDHAFGPGRTERFGWASTIHVALFAPRGR